jgi:CTP synthase
VYGTTEVAERHRHRYEVNNAYRDRLEQAGLRVSGVSALTEDHSLVEFVELDPTVHPFYIGTQAHPELKSRPTRAHPLFAGLVGAALDLQKATRLLEVEPDGTVPELAEGEAGHADVQD